MQHALDHHSHQLPGQIILRRGAARAKTAHHVGRGIQCAHSNSNRLVLLIGEGVDRFVRDLGGVASHAGDVGAVAVRVRRRIARGNGDRAHRGVDRDTNLHPLLGALLHDDAEHSSAVVGGEGEFQFFLIGNRDALAVGHGEVLVAGFEHGHRGLGLHAVHVNHVFLPVGGIP